MRLFHDMPHLIACINRRMLARDGLHLSYKGTEHAVNCIEGAIHMLWTTKERVQRRLSAMIPPTSTEATPPSSQDRNYEYCSCIRNQHHQDRTVMLQPLDYLLQRQSHNRRPANLLRQLHRSLRSKRCRSLHLR